MSSKSNIAAKLMMMALLVAATAWMVDARVGLFSPQQTSSEGAAAAADNDRAAGNKVPCGHYGQKKCKDPDNNGVPDKDKCKNVPDPKPANSDGDKKDNACGNNREKSKTKGKKASSSPDTIRDSRGPKRVSSTR